MVIKTQKVGFILISEPSNKTSSSPLAFAPKS